MNSKTRRLRYFAWLAWLMLCVATPAASGDGAKVPAEDTQISGRNNSDRARTQLQQRFVSEFGEFAGSTENAQNLYNGLRHGSRITLTMPIASGNVGRGTAVLQFNPAGRPMGIGGAFITMALVRQQLANHGITRPAPAQMRAALNGGFVTNGDLRAGPVALKGVLAQRAQGLGWQAIARASGISPVRILDGLRNPAPDPVAAAAAGADAHVRAVTRGRRHAAADGVPAPLRTSAREAASGDSLTAH